MKMKMGIKNMIKIFAIALVLLSLNLTVASAIDVTTDKNIYNVGEQVTTNIINDGVKPITLNGVNIKNSTGDIIYRQDIGKILNMGDTFTWIWTSGENVPGSYESCGEFYDPELNNRFENCYPFKIIAALNAVIRDYFGDENKSITFDASQSTGAILRYTWDFGDGTIITKDPAIDGWQVNHTYADNDTYNISLTVFNDSESDIATAKAYVNNIPPVVDTGEDQTVSGRDAVNFKGVYSDAPIDFSDRENTTIEWNFGDGTAITGNANQNNILTPSHLYAAEGIYNVELLVTDKDGATGNDFVSITIAGGLCNCEKSSVRPKFLDNKDKPIDIIKITADRVTGRGRGAIEVKIDANWVAKIICKNTVETDVCREIFSLKASSSDWKVNVPKDPKKGNGDNGSASKERHESTLGLNFQICENKCDGVERSTDFSTTYKVTVENSDRDGFTFKDIKGKVKLEVLPSFCKDKKSWTMVIAVDSTIKGNYSENASDYDGDGVDNGVEKKTDSDGDKLSDYEEMLIGTDPTKKDTDGDGVDDKKDNFPLDKDRQ